MNPYILLAVCIGWAASIGAAGYWAYGAGQDKCIAEQARDVAVAQIASEAAAEAIAKIKVQNTTIRQTLEKEVRENTIYRDCRSGPGPVGVLNATPGIAKAASAPGELPRTGATD
jgi:hypothetical protein